MNELDKACKNNNIEEVKKLLKYCNVNSKNEYGDAPLHVACRYNYIDIAELLLEKEADINIKNEDCNTALHYACEKSYKDIIKLLINTDSINILNNDNKYPLDYLSEYKLLD